MVKVQKCVICGKKFTGYGNNPSPLKEKGVCCNSCNLLVIQERISQYTQKGDVNV